MFAALGLYMQLTGEQERQAVRVFLPWVRCVESFDTLVPFWFEKAGAAVPGVIQGAAVCESLPIVRSRFSAAVAALQSSLLQWRVAGATEIAVLCTDSSDDIEIASLVTDEIVDLVFGRERSHVEVLRALGDGLVGALVYQRAFRPEWLRMLVSVHCDTMLFHSCVRA